VEDAMNEGLLLARLAIGLLMAAHGSQKLFGWLGGHGLAGTAGFFEAIGFRPGRLFATAAAVGELASGVLLAIGLLEPVAAAVMLSVMIVAAASVHWEHGLFASTNGIEVPLLYGVSAAALALTGPGAYSVDAVLGLTSLWTPPVVLAVLAAGVIGGFANLAARRTAPVQAIS
jgi:putative oxidoreductase